MDNKSIKIKNDPQAIAAGSVHRQATGEFRPINPEDDALSSYHSGISSYRSKSSYQTKSSRNSDGSDARSIYNENFWSKIDQVLAQEASDTKKHFDETIIALAASLEAIQDMAEYQAAINELLEKYYHSESIENQVLEAVLFYTIQDTTQNLINRGDDDSFRILFLEQPKLIRFIHNDNDEVVEQKILDWVQDYIIPQYGIDEATLVVKNCRKYNAEFRIFDEYRIENLLKDWGVHTDDIEIQVENLNVAPLAKLKAPQINFGSQRRSDASVRDSIGEADKSFGSDHDDASSYTGEQVPPSLDNSAVYPEGIWRQEPANEKELQTEFDELSINESAAQDHSAPRVSTPIPQDEIRVPAKTIMPQATSSSPVAAGNNPANLSHK